MKIFALTNSQFRHNSKINTSFKSNDYADKKNNLQKSFYDSMMDTFNKDMQEQIDAIKKDSQERQDNVKGLFKKRKRMQIQRETEHLLEGLNLGFEAATPLMKETSREISKTLASVALSKTSIDKQADYEKRIERKSDFRKNVDSKKGFDSIAGYDKEKEFLTKSFLDLVQKERNGQDVLVPNVISFFGPSGNGKTRFAYALAQEVGCDLKNADLKVYSKSREMNQKKHFEELVNIATESQINYEKTGKRTMILIDDIERLAYPNSTILPELVDFFKNCSQKYHCTVLTTFVHPNSLSESVLSNEVMPIKIAMDFPDKKDTVVLFNHYLNGSPNVNMEEINLDELSEEVMSVRPNAYYNNSQIERVCSHCVSENENVTQSDLLDAIRKETLLFKAEDVERFKKEKDEFSVGI